MPSNEANKSGNGEKIVAVTGRVVRKIDKSHGFLSQIQSIQYSRDDYEQECQIKKKEQEEEHQAKRREELERKATERGGFEPNKEDVNQRAPRNLGTRKGPLTRADNVLFWGHEGFAELQKEDREKSAKERSYRVPDRDKLSGLNGSSGKATYQILEKKVILEKQTQVRNQVRVRPDHCLYIPPKRIEGILALRSLSQPDVQSSGVEIVKKGRGHMIAEASVDNKKPVDKKQFRSDRLGSQADKKCCERQEKAPSQNEQIKEPIHILSSGKTIQRLSESLDSQNSTQSSTHSGIQTTYDDSLEDSTGSERYSQRDSLKENYDYQYDTQESQETEDSKSVPFAWHEKRSNCGREDKFIDFYAETSSEKNSCSSRTEEAPHLQPAACARNSEHRCACHRTSLRLSDMLREVRSCVCRCQDSKEANLDSVHSIEKKKEKKTKKKNKSNSNKIKKADEHDGTLALVMTIQCDGVTKKLRYYEGQDADVAALAFCQKHHLGADRQKQYAAALAVHLKKYLQGATG